MDKIKSKKEQFVVKSKRELRLRFQRKQSKKEQFVVKSKRVCDRYCTAPEI